MKKYRSIPLITAFLITLSTAFFKPLSIATVNVGDNIISTEQPCVPAVAPNAPSIPDDSVPTVEDTSVANDTEAPTAQFPEITYDDSDGDGIIDSVEQLLYGTSPSNPDTDGDGLSDGDEISIGLDPTVAQSDGKTLDSDRMFTTELTSESFSASLLSDANAAIPSLTVTANGNIAKQISVLESRRSDITSAIGIIGKALEIDCAEPFFGQLTFTLEKMPENGLDTYVICKYANGITEYPVSLPIDGKPSVTAEIDGAGIYFLLDAQQLWDALYQTVSADEKQLIYLDGPIPTPVYLNSPLSDRGDTDGDGISDADELGSLEPTGTFDLSVPASAIGMSDDPVEIETYGYISSPVSADTDFDGIGDSEDAEPRNNLLHGRLASFNKDGDTLYSANEGRITFLVDYRLFFGDNAHYNNDISALSALLSLDIYDDSEDIPSDSNSDLFIDGILEDAHHTEELLEVIGLSDVKRIAVGYEDSDRTELVIGHRRIDYRGESREIVPIVIRGTNGTFEEWSSNFDVGADTDEYYSMTGEHPEWLTKDNHKGFDITAVRVKAAVEAYINDVGLDKDDLTYWIMGHSRAAAVANVLGAYLINEGKEPFVYTFACPNTTTASDADNYKGIFNVVNGDDLIPKLPLASWGFCRYGTDRLLTVSEHSGNRTVTGGAYKGGAFKAYFGINYNNNGKLGLLLDEFGSVADDRDELYVLTMEEDTLSINGSDSDTPEEALIKAQEYMSQHPPIFGQLGIYTSVQAKTFFGSTVYRVGCYQTPAYFMQTLAYLAANEGGMDVITGGRLIPVADKYTNARNYFVLTYLSGMSHPHWCETYYLIASGAFEGVYPRNG